MRWRALWLAALLSAGAAQAAPPSVAITGGTVQGSTDAHGTQIFRAIPYAAPPLGAQRWRPPAPITPWKGLRDAAKAAPSCLQNDYGWNHADYVRASEDCLTLDVATAALTGKRPVMVWIHGGSNRAGSAGDTVLSPLAQRGVVLVAIQYRLGIFGNLPHRALASEQGGHTGNYGLMDQIAALRWVQANIARFGGDPANVTIFGESAGGQDVGLLLAAPSTQGLFARAILQSGTPSFGLTWRPLPEALRIGDQLDAVLGTNGGIEPLRAASAHALLEADRALHDPALQSDDFLWLRTTIDGMVLPDTPAALMAHTLPRPVIIGSNRAEFGLPGGRPHRDAGVDAAFGPNADKARTFYHLDQSDPPADPRLGNRDLRIATDILFRCPAGQWADVLSRAGSKVWRYEFDLAANGGLSFHGSDISYVLSDARFGSLSLADYWLSFAKSGDPNDDARPPWPAFGPNKQHVLFTASGASVQTQEASPCQWMIQP
ncbi:carboxylesterase/lipase family protein [Novosphingobium sediminicola]|uniref:Carboxylic ester hydrolase n=1 Tax=Novosphingobium sediminicola TaxID=563162 RepID=A0A7W6CH95_9SPHN|nr:carboxylesterase family protein [Novosphingobium sediminicola]MBB3953750.1 para-nitrobenzyl esterase [Novosphingobium sediminicola]